MQFDDSGMDYTELIKNAHEYQKGKTCTDCDEHKELIEFAVNRKSKDGLKSQCRACCKIAKDNTCQVKKWYQHKKGSAKAKGIPFTIKPQDIPSIEVLYRKNIRGIWTWEATEFPTQCPVLSLPKVPYLLDWSGGKRQWEGPNRNAPSLDRMDPDLGYIPGNVMIVSMLANGMKQNATPEQLKQFARWCLGWV